MLEEKERLFTFIYDPYCISTMIFLTLEKTIFVIHSCQLKEAICGSIQHIWHPKVYLEFEVFVIGPHMLPQIEFRIGFVCGVDDTNIINDWVKE